MAIERDKSALLSLPFVRFAPFFAAGMLTVYFGGGAPGAIFFAAAAAALIFSAARRSPAVLCAAGALCGAALMAAYLLFYCAPILKYAGSTVDARIFVRDIAERSGRSGEVIAKIRLDGRTAKVRLYCAEMLSEDNIADVTIALERSEMTADDLANGILLSGEVTEVRSAEYAGLTVYGVFRAVRRGFYDGLAANVFGESGELASAVLFGENDSLSPRYAEYLRISGAAHYTAVSGAHFAILAAALLAIVPQKRRRTRVVLSLMFAPAGLLFYGASPSVLRASVMFFLYAAAMLFHRKANTLNSLCVSVVAISLVSPFTVMDAGFAMSVLGVLGVGVVGPGVSEKLCEFIPDKAKRALTPAVTAFTCSVCAVICTAPVSAALFKGVSMAGAFTSLLLAPLIAAAMTFMLLLGLTGIQLFAVPIDWAMKAAAFIVRAVGRVRAFMLPLDFRSAWILAAAVAVLTAVCAFGDMKTFVRFGKAALAAALISPIISAAITANRHEVRFVGNTYTSAAIVFERNTASVFISGGGDGLSTAISRVLREHGALSVTELYAPDADYGGALAIKELSAMLPVGRVYSNGLARALLPALDTEDAPADKTFRAGGVTIASANAPLPEADILLYGGSADRLSESPARYAIYFSKAERELPDNFHNARVNRDFCIRL